jgi:hypothetical protein
MTQCEIGGREGGEGIAKWGCVTKILWEMRGSYMSLRDARAREGKYACVCCGICKVGI